jgi:H+/Na+-translocating ferredoxin:NAD+ oxidoreductase subunit E
MNEGRYAAIAREGLWSNNAAVVQLLGLCPLLAVSNDVVNGLGLGVATLFVLVSSNVVISLIRNIVPNEVRIPIFVLVIASLVSAVDLIMDAYWHELHGVLGIFIPLIVVNCNIIRRAEVFASKSSVDRAFMDGLMSGIGFALALVVLGGLRELIGHGTLLERADLMFGQGAEWMTIRLFHDYPGFLLAVLPPGAFMGFGLLVAVKNVIDRRLARRAAKPVPAERLAEAGA